MSTDSLCCFDRRRNPTLPPLTVWCNEHHIFNVNIMWVWCKYMAWRMAVRSKRWKWCVLIRIYPVSLLPYLLNDLLHFINNKSSLQQERLSVGKYILSLFPHTTITDNANLVFAQHTRPLGYKKLTGVLYYSSVVHLLTSSDPCSSIVYS